MNDYDDRTTGRGALWLYFGMAVMAMLPLVLAIFGGRP